MTRGLPIDIVAVHKKLWEKKNRTGKVKVYQKQFALFCGISAPHMSRIMKRLQEEERIKKVGASYRNVGVYLIKDPNDFPDPDQSLRATGVGPAT